MLQPELKQRRDKIRVLMAQRGIDAALIACNVNLIYTYGTVVSGYLYLPLESPARLFVKRPNNITGEHVLPVRKPEQLPELILECGLPLPKKLMLEGDELSFTEYNRLAACFPEAEVVPCGSSLIRQARSIKTVVEIEIFRRSGAAHAKAYEQIPSVYRPGMTDRQLSIEIERLMRLEGCLGIFRVFGRSMEIFMGSLLRLIEPEGLGLGRVVLDNQHLKPRPGRFCIDALKAPAQILDMVHIRNQNRDPRRTCNLVIDPIGRGEQPIPCLSRNPDPLKVRVNRPLCRRGHKVLPQRRRLPRISWSRRSMPSVLYNTIQGGYS